MSKQLTDMRVAARRRLAGGMWVIDLKTADGSALPAIRPGQFAQIKIEGTLLRRPISICDVLSETSLRMLVRPVGDATHRLCEAPEGTVFNLLLPLGNGFSLVPACSSALLVGGGVGCAPLSMLCRELLNAGAAVTVAVGARTAADLNGIADLYDGALVAMATDDGSAGLHGLVTALPVFGQAYDHIYVCGPTPMMKAVARIARENRTPCSVSLENMMACGLGACLCCVEKTVRGNVCVCTEGPVFDINELTWQ